MSERLADLELVGVPECRHYRRRQRDSVPHGRPVRAGDVRVKVG